MRGSILLCKRFLSCGGLRETDQLSISKFAQPPHESIPDESKCTYQTLHWCNTIPNGNGDHSSDFGTSGKAGTLASAQPGLHNGQFRNWPTQLWNFSISSLLNQTHMEVEADVVVEHVSVPLDEWDDAWDGVMRPRRPGHHLPNPIAIAGPGGLAEHVPNSLRMSCQREPHEIPTLWYQHFCGGHSKSANAQLLRRYFPPEGEERWIFCGIDTSAGVAQDPHAKPPRKSRSFIRRIDDE